MKQTNQDKSAAKEKCTVKKPYHKPKVRYERVFETLALSCGKVQVTDYDCTFNRKSS